MLDTRRPNRRSKPNGKSRVLVVGTTPDYVELLHKGHPDECLFLTESRLRLQAKEPDPGCRNEVLYRGDRQLSAIALLERHQERYDIEIAGVACFDCESMPLASLIAERWGLPYPSPESIAYCRNKGRMKQRWKSSQTANPRFSIVNREEETVGFLRQVGGPCVMKPLSGSGSELVFRVEDEDDCRRSFEAITAGLASRRAAPLYRSNKEGHASVLMEEWVAGDEFSCDFLVEEGCVRVVRLTRKHLRRNGPPGTVEAYEISPNPPDACRSSRLEPWLQQASTSLGIERALCMADFIMQGEQPKLLELTPRCGGDCLPPLLKTACDFDMLGLAIRFARETVDEAVVQVEEPAVALRLFADRAGTLAWTDTTTLTNDRRVLSASLVRRIGDQVQLPPHDYDSWILGHVIYRPESGRSVSEQNEELKSLFQVKIAEK